MRGRELTPMEHGFLLLTSNLGNPHRRPLSVARFRELTERVRLLGGTDASRELQPQDLISLGYSSETARHIVSLLEEEDLLKRYLIRAEKCGCVPITRASADYPLILRKRLGMDSPGVLWAKGDLSLLNTPSVALVGSRELRQENLLFAKEAGRRAALQGLTLVSGNARGADKTAQNACLEAGGRVISIVADSLAAHKPRENVLYLSENDFDEEFSSQRALSRNRSIHAMGILVFVAQADLHKGGTWDGTAKNLRNGWSPVVCFNDGSQAAAELELMGAYLAVVEDLRDFCALQRRDISLFDM